VQTHALQPGSVLINAGNNALLPTDTFDLDGDSNTSEPLPLDATGQTRIRTGKVDIGAVEYNAPLTVTLSVNNTSVDEATDASTVTATLSEAAATATTVTIGRKSSSTATQTADFTLSSSTITIPAGSTTGTATLTAVQDTLDEDNETAIIEITGVSGGDGATENGTQEITVTINDDDATPSLSVANASLTEGNSGSNNMSFTVTLDAPSGQIVTVVCATSNGSATAGSDYTAASTTLTFSPGNITKTFTVPVLGDSTQESNETFTVTLSNANNATIVAPTATGTITNDDNALPAFIGAITTLSINENASATDIKALLHIDDQDAGQAITWTQNVATNHGGALAISSATAASGSANITPGGTVTYAPAANFTGTETFTIQASDGPASTTRQITVTVSDVNPVLAPSLTLNVEENSAANTAVGTVTPTGDTNGLRGCEKIDGRISVNLDERATRHYTIGCQK